MLTTLQVAKERVLRLLNDSPVYTVIAEDSGGDSGDVLYITGGTTYPSDLLEDAIHAALEAITSRIWKTSVWIIEEAGTEFDEMPDDLIDILSVYDTGLSQYIPKVQQRPGASGVSSEYQNSWIDIPSGTITFSVALTDYGARVYYMVPWTKPDNDGDILEPPDNVLNAILFYACSYCLLKEASGISTIRQYNTRVDSGKPTDNPTNEMANYFLKRFEIEMSRIPLKVREQMQ